MITTNTTLQELFDAAVLSLKDVLPDEEFIVKDLFRGFEWNRIPRGDRTKLGSMFLAFAGKEGADLLEALGKTPQNQQIYRKK